MNMKARNPVLPLNYHCPDGEPHYINNELFVYPSYDYSKGGYCSNKLFVAHSKDLSKWVIDGPAFESSKLDWEIMPCYPAGLPETNTYEELPNYIKDYLPKHMEKFIPFKWFKGYLMWIMEKLQGKDISKRLLYAPDSITIGDKSYLFFCTSDDCEGVAVSNDPAGPFENPIKITMDKSGTPIKGIDPGVFRDDDGRVYLYWGQINSFGAELTDDLTKVKEDTMVKNLLTEKEHCFHEGSSMRKIGDTYYYIFADTHRGKTTALGYATSKSPLGPFEYHRSTGNSRYLRRMCAEPIHIDENGYIAEVPVTSIGMGEPYKVGELLYGYQACQVKNAYIDNDKLVIKKGKSEVVYRYIDGNAMFSAIRYEGNGELDLSYKVDKSGELTIYMETKRQVEIKSFILQ